MIVLKFHKNRFSDDVIMTVYLISLGFFAKGENSVTKGNLAKTFYPTWNDTRRSSVDRKCSITNERVA